MVRIKSTLFAQWPTDLDIFNNKVEKLSQYKSFSDMCPFFFNQETVAQFALKILHSFKKYILIFLDVRKKEKRERAEGEK